MSARRDARDLTRWNRAGLSRFRYVDGNAVTYLERLRLAMVDAFTDAEGENRWSALERALPVPPDETSAQRQARWLEQYRAERRDYAWEIMRCYARAAHVLTEHLDAYANETTIATATQWESLRRLVETIDYHPAPPASAETTIALLAKHDKTGRVEAGFSFKNKPEDGSEAAVFETLADLDIDYRLNQLKARDWNRSQRPLDYDPVLRRLRFPLQQPVPDLSAGTLGVLLIESAGYSVAGFQARVSAVTDRELTLLVSGFPAAGVRRHQARLLLKPEFIESPRLRGADVVGLGGDHGLVAGDVVAWKVGNAWRAAKVLEIDSDRVRLSGAAPDRGKELHLASYADARVLATASGDRNRVVLPTRASGSRERSALWDRDLQAIGSYYTQQDSDATSALYDYVSGNAFTRVYYLPTADKVASVLVTAPQDLRFTGKPGDLAGGDWVLCASDSTIQAARITELEQGEDDYRLQLSPMPIAPQRLHADFEFDLRPLDYDHNDRPVFATQPALRSNNHSLIELQADAFTEQLRVGRALVIAGEQQAMSAVVSEVDAANNRIKVAPAIPGSELDADGQSENYSRYATVIYANAVAAGHGERQNEKILGSGDATQSGQNFVLDADDLSFVTDRAFPSGVRAALEVLVGQRAWQQQATLHDSTPEDPHYLVRMQEDGRLRLVFGDGRRGRRLPSGSNNVRVRYRTGNGLTGNLPPMSLVKEVKPHALVESLVQPIAASGGNVMEGHESLRENAPASLLTLDRAVSLSDFTHLAATNSSVWQALALRRGGGVGRRERIDVVVVPAGGGALGKLQATLEAYLNGKSLPGVQVSVLPYRSILLELELLLRIDTAVYDPALVMAEVSAALLDDFSLRRMKLGAPLYRSQVVRSVERVAGVASCDCRLNPQGFFDTSGSPTTPLRVIRGPDGAIKKISLQESQVIYLHADLSQLDLTWSEKE